MGYKSCHMHSSRKITASNSKHISTAPEMHFWITVPDGFTGNDRGSLHVWSQCHPSFCFVWSFTDTSHPCRCTHQCGVPFLRWGTRKKTLTDLQVKGNLCHESIFVLQKETNLVVLTQDAHYPNCSSKQARSHQQVNCWGSLHFFPRLTFTCLSSQSLNTCLLSNYSGKDTALSAVGDSSPCP